MAICSCGENIIPGGRDPLTHPFANLLEFLAVAGLSEDLDVLKYLVLKVISLNWALVIGTNL